MEKISNSEIMQVPEYSAIISDPLQTAKPIKVIIKQGNIADEITDAIINWTNQRLIKCGRLHKQISDRGGVYFENYYNKIKDN